MKTGTHQAKRAMPILTRENLAQRFRQNWLASHPQDVPPTMRIDDSLTSLSWLQNLSISKMPGSATAAATEMPQLTPRPSNHIDMRVNPNAVLEMLPISRQNSNCSSNSGDTFISVHPPVTNQVHDDIDYKNNPYVKPPYSYATLICMAMKESKKNKITLSGIYSWITDNYMYYRVADPSWQNSIRHNLSLNKCFQKVPRRKDEPGKGGFWRVNPEYSDMFENGVFKRRRSTTTREMPLTMPPAKRIKRDPEDAMLSAALSDGQSIVIRNQSGIDETVTIGNDFNWNNILQQDIEIGGKRIKTEQLIDDQEVLAATNSIMDDAASPIMDLSPPPSVSNSDIGLDEFLNYDLSQVGNEFDGALDLRNSDPLDLSITGTSIKPPEWWSDALSGEACDAPLGLHNPLAPPLIDELSHPWAESPVKVEEAMVNFDIDLERLFTDDSLTYSDC